MPMSSAVQSSRELSVPDQYDQASGLRQLFAQHSPQLIAFSSAAAFQQRSQLLVEAALALATQRQRVLLIDENASAKSAASHLLGIGVVPPDLLKVMRGETTVEAALYRVGDLPLRVALAARLAQADMPPSRRLTQLMQHFEAEYDYVLIDCATASPARLSALAGMANHLTIAVAVEGRGIMQAYAHVKRLAQSARRTQMQVLITSDCSREAARLAFNNLRQVAGEHLQVQLHHLNPAAAGGEALAAALDSALPRRVMTAVQTALPTRLQPA